VHDTTQFFGCVSTITGDATLICSVWRAVAKYSHVPFIEGDKSAPGSLMANVASHKVTNKYTEGNRILIQDVQYWTVMLTWRATERHEIGTFSIATPVLVNRILERVETRMSVAVRVKGWS
jgi:hypothetical protein